MEDLRQTALAYYTTATKEIQRFVDEFYSEMDPKDVGHVKFKEFAKYMETIDCKHMSSEEFFDELRHPYNDVLYFEDIIALFYIIHSGRPFCGGSCKKFVKGMYFTCVKCYEDTHRGNTTTFSVCSQCFSNEKNYKHEHQEFLDPIVLLHFKRMEALYKHSKSSSTVDPVKLVIILVLFPSSSYKILIFPNIFNVIRNIYFEVLIRFVVGAADYPNFRGLCGQERSEDYNCNVSE